MGLQFGKNKCVKMHIGKYHISLICSDSKVEAWEDTIVTRDDGFESIQDMYVGKVTMNNVLGTWLFACKICDNGKTS